ncbi:MAG: nucleotide exchange factor GrpE [Anaerolineae bacterium]
MTEEETMKVAAEEPAETQAESAKAADATPTEKAPDAATQAYIAEMAAAMKKADEFKDAFMRERADFQNYKKRIETQMKDLRENAAVETMMSLLPIIDDLERALVNTPAEMKEHPWVEGVGGIQRKFQKLLDDKGVMVIDPVGEAFNPNQHEAVAMGDDGNTESGHVIETLQKGYIRGERVLRPAMVKVAN